LNTLLSKSQMKSEFAAVSILLLLAGPALAEVAGQASVIDGDTIDIHGQRIRLHGIDAPEKGQPCFDAGQQPYRCGQKAAMALDEFIGGSSVTCEEQDVDRYGRIVARCMVRGQSINAWLVRKGYAMAYRKYSGDYVPEETEARNAHRGVWSGSLLPPWEWRKQKRERQ
jgi:endonuclease YncB( thermonuclease family)